MSLPDPRIVKFFNYLDLIVLFYLVPISVDLWLVYALPMPDNLRVLALPVSFVMLLILWGQERPRFLRNNERQWRQLLTAKKRETDD